MNVEKALINYASIKNDLRQINKRISDQILLSEESTFHLRDKQNIPANKSYWLYMAYERESDGYGDVYYVNHEDDVEGYLEENCKHALGAHRLIQQRKEIKKRFGIAKSIISRYATRLLILEKEKKADNAKTETAKG